MISSLSRNHRGGASAAPVASSQDIQVLWANHDYQKVIDLCGPILARNPIDFQALLYRGFSYFYQGISQPDDDTKDSYLENATVDLRKAIVVEPFRQNSDIYYILGKVYFHRGYFYQDLSKDYLLRAANAGYKASDLNEDIGLVVEALGDPKGAIEYLKQAVKDDPRDIVLLSLARAYIIVEDYTTATSLIDRIIDKSKDAVTVQQARFNKGDILTKQGKTDEAISEYESILKDNPNSADAHFYLGEAYAAKGDTIKARAQWRETINIDPKHSGALSRLNS